SANAVPAAATLPSSIDLSVVIPGLHEGRNLRILLPALKSVLKGLGVRFEILVVTVGLDDETGQAAQLAGCTLLEQQDPGYGGALRSGFQRARGRFIATMDADLSHDPSFL